MRSLGLPGLGFFDPCWPEKPETDWDDKPGLPRLVIPVRFGNFWSFLARKPGNGLGGQAWASQACHPSPFQGFLALFGRKTPKWTGMMTSLGFPGLSSQSVSWFFGCFQLENLEASWDDQPGFPRLVIPVRFGFCLARFGQKARNGLG